MYFSGPHRAWRVDGAESLRRFQCAVKRIKIEEEVYEPVEPAVSRYSEGVF
jgi:hypothetical protein